MIRLKNIELNSHFINCDIFPEDATEAGHITIDTKKGTIESYSLPKGYEWCKKHIYHALSGLTKMAQSGNIQRELSIAWC